MDLQAARRRRARQLSGRRRASTRKRWTMGRRRRPRATTRKRRRPSARDRPRRLSRRGVSPAGLPRRCDPDRRSGDRGSPLKGVVTARYLFGAPMVKRPIAWSYSRAPVLFAPAAVDEQVPGRSVRVRRLLRRQQPPAAGTDLGEERGARREGTARARSARRGRATASRINTRSKATSRTCRASTSPGAPRFLVHPASWYIGLQRPSGSFVEQKDGLKTAVVAVSPMGVAGARRQGRRHARAGAVEQRAARRGQRLLHVGHRAQGDRSRTLHRHDRRRSGAALDSADRRRFVHAEGHRARDAPIDRRRRGCVSTSLGTGYTAWARYDHNRIDLVPERETYKPGETARLMIQSPWEKATALLTVEREGIRSHTQFALTSTQQTVTVPITAADIPNLYVSVLLVKGRTNVRRPGGLERSRQAVVPPRLREAQRGRRVQATVRERRRRTRRSSVPPDTAKVDLLVKDAQRRAGAERGDALGRGLRRPVADRLSHARRARLGVRPQGAAGDERPTAASASSAAAC